MPLGVPCMCPVSYELNIHCPESKQFFIVPDRDKPIFIFKAMATSYGGGVTEIEGVPVFGVEL